MERCTACGFDYGSVGRPEIPGRLSDFGRRYRARLVAPGPPDPAALHRRLGPDRWTALEYAGHAADVFQVQHQRLALALFEPRPTFVSMEPERRVVEGRYELQDPGLVSHRLAEVAHDLAAAFVNLTPEQWDRTGVYNWPTVEERTMTWLGRHTVHEGEHHLGDIDALVASEPER